MSSPRSARLVASPLVVARLALAASVAVSAAVALATTGCSSAPSPAAGAPDDARKAELAKRWKLYVSNDPEWPAARKQWLAGPERERQLLLDNLLIELMRLDSTTRTRRELTWFGSEAVPPLVEGLKDLASKPAVDVVTLDRLGNALTDLHATKELGELAAAPPDPKAADGGAKLRLAALRALVAIDDPAVTKTLLDRLEHDPSWQVRGAAATALRKESHATEVRVALVQALSDRDGFVRGQAMRALVVGLDPAQDQPAFDRVFAFLAHDPDPSARAATVDSLTLLVYDERVAAALRQTLQHDGAGEVVSKAARALAGVKTQEVRLALVDALEGAIHRRDEGLVSELLAILGANVGATPPDVNPAGWRAFLAQRAAAH
jgi:HEAT repeat protein